MNILNIIQYSIFQGRFINPTVVVGEINASVTLMCNSSSIGLNESFTWNKSPDSFQLDSLLNDNKTTISDDGQQLTINNLTLSDQLYYGCFNGTTFLNTFRLIVRSK